MTDGKPRLPDVLIAGVPKAGTSTLARWLGAHPDVYLPPDKEVHYFDDRRHVPLKWYREQFAGPGRVAVDATPTYALRDESMAAAMQAVPDARVVLLLRHPVQRLWSAYWYLRSMGFEARTLEQVVHEGLAPGGDGTTRLSAGDYGPLLERVDQHVDRDRVLVLLQDDLASSPDDVWARTCTFLSLDPVARPTHLGEQLNVTGMLRSFPLRYWSLRLHLFRRVPRLALAADRWNRTDRRPPPMPDELRKALLDHYEQSTRAVEARLDRDLSAWRS